jgi:prophage tail gpP-like protein
VVRGLGYRLWAAAAEGRTAVVVDRPASSGAPLFTLLRELVNGRVTEASNLLAGKEVTSIKEVPSVVTAFADAPRGDSTSAKISREVANGFLLTDAAAARVSLDAPPRPRYLQSRSATTEAGAHNEASRVCAQANERFRVLQYSVLGHRQNGRLWVPNVRVALRDDLVGIDATVLCVSVQYTGSRDEGPKTRLTLLPDGALSELPETDS